MFDAAAPPLYPKLISLITILVKEGDVKKTTFCCAYNHFEFINGGIGFKLANNQGLTSRGARCASILCKSKVKKKKFIVKEQGVGIPSYFKDDECDYS